MSRKNRKPRSSRPAASPEPPRALTAARAGVRRWTFRLLAATGVPVALLLAIELGLRWSGSGYPTAYFRAWHHGPTNLWVENLAFARRFFPATEEPEPRPFALPATKAANTSRVFVLGESAALGDPDPKFSFPRMLQALLQGRFPNRRFEVVNLSFVAINSHVIRAIARECTSRQGDAWILYLGNNEVIGPFGAATAFGPQVPPLPVIRANLALKTTRTGQWLDALMQSARGVASRAEAGGLELMADQRVPRDDPRMNRVAANFRRNLNDILAAANTAGVPVLLCTVAVNLRDCPPFASVHPPSLTGARLAEWHRAFDDGRTLERQGRLADALEAYERAACIDAGHAELQFRTAVCQQSLGRGERAGEAYRMALDLDALPVRTSTRLNGLIRDAAASHAGRNIRLIDVEAAMSAASPVGAPGAEFFYEHVHLTPEGNYFIARALADPLAQALGLASAPGSSPPGPRTGAATGVTWLPLPDCLRAIGFAPWHRFNNLESMLHRMGQPPFTGQCGHAERVQRSQQALALLEPGTHPAALQAALRETRERVAQEPNDPEFRRILATLCDAVADVDGAVAQWQEVGRLLPHSPFPDLTAATLLRNAGRLPEAESHYREAIRRDPKYPACQAEFGFFLAGQGRFQEAIPCLERAVRARPRAADLRLELGRACLALGRKNAAREQAQAVLDQDPAHPVAKRLLERTR